jgi:phage tail protein X
MFQNLKGRFKNTWGARFVCILAAMLLPIFGLLAGARADSLIYKNYIIRYDRGWDILCEPYEVRPNDWVLKIFRQKGEIAHQDFREFLGIFTRLNPHVRDINMIRPGQTIDIPLRKLEHGALPGQSTGVVTIPFVTLSKVTQVVKQHSEQYQVRRGDTVSQLIARHYGRFGSKAYQEGIKLFQAANPQIENLDLIYAGQQLYLPDPAIRDQSWYESLYDADGNLKEVTQPQTQAPESPRATPNAITPPPLPAAPEQVPQQTPLAEAAAIVGGNFFNKGTYYLPDQGKEDFEVDLSRHPLLDLDQQGKILFAQEGRLMDLDADQAKTKWPSLHVVSVNQQSSTPEIIDSIFKELNPTDTQSQSVEIGFSDNGVQVAVHAKWARPEADQQTLCITPINNPGEFTPESFRRYLEQHGIVLKEVLPSGEARIGAQTAPSQRHAVQNILALAPTSQKGFIQDLSKALGFTYAPNVKITFPYAGIQVEAYAHLVSAGGGREVLVDYGDLYGDALSAIAQAGPSILQFKADDDYGLMASKLLSALGLDFAESPTFWAAQRPPDLNTAVTVQGLLYFKAEDSRILLTSARLHPAVNDLLTAAGVAIVVW